MHKFLLMVGGLMLVTGCSSFKGEVRERDSFNDGWKFNSYGQFPNSKNLQEPGGEIITATASTSGEAIERDGAVKNILDNNPSTFWNSAANNGEWVAIDLNKSHSISSMYMTWGFSGSPEIKVEFRDKNNKWEKVEFTKASSKAGSLKIDFAKPYKKTNGVKITLVKMPENSWPRIGEVHIFDESGKQISYEPEHDKRLSPKSVDFDSSEWENVVIPHDWAISGPFSNELDHATGLLPWMRVGWYRKDFTIPLSDKGKRILLNFDGAMANSEVYLNGELVGGWPYGYNSFFVDLTDKLKYGEKNVLAVRLDTVKFGSRWYPGGGIYRNVWLVKTEPVHVGQWGVYVTTPKVTKEDATAQFDVTVKNDSNKDAKVNVKVLIEDEDGVRFTSDSKSANIKKGESADLRLIADIKNPKLWDIKTPHIYKGSVVVETNGKVTDEYPLTFGVRTISVTARDGLLLNGKRVQVNGVCLHHDLGPLGAAVNTRAIERQLQIMQEMGCNAIRTSHNPPTPELLDLCDKMGLLVMDEAFDAWKTGKRPDDYSALFDKWHEKDLAAMIKRDRNHPSIFMWSIGNEVPDQMKPKMVKSLSEIVHKLDPTRKTVLCSNDGHTGLSEVAQSVDVTGYNYNLWAYSKFFNRKENKNTPLIGSETSSCLSTRGEYFFPADKNKLSDFQVTSYDSYYPGWGCTPDTQFEMLEKYPAVIGEFVWTGFDYIGEPTPYNNDATVLLNFKNAEDQARQKERLEKLGKIDVPSRSSYFGIVDLCGFPKDRYYIYQSHWRPNLPMAHIFPHWNWPERVGKVTPVHVYTSGDEAELFLNGKSLGRKKKEKYQYRLRWDDVVYQPGELKVVAYKDGKKWAEDVVRTTGAPAQLSMIADRNTIVNDGKDLSFITLKVCDDNGLTVPDADVPVQFTIEGPAEIIATGNGDPTSHELFQDTKRMSFNGLALVIIRSKKGESGTVKVTATSKSLKSAKVEVEVKNK